MTHAAEFCQAQIGVEVPSQMGGYKYSADQLLPRQQNAGSLQAVQTTPPVQDTLDSSHSFSLIALYISMYHP